MQDKFILMWAKVNLKKVAVTSAILIKHFSYIFYFCSKEEIQHSTNWIFLQKATETILIYTPHYFLILAKYLNKNFCSLA